MGTLANAANALKDKLRSDAQELKNGVRKYGAAAKDLGRTAKKFLIDNEIEGVKAVNEHGKENRAAYRASKGK